MGLARAALAKDRQIGAAVDPALAGRQGQDMGFAKTRGGVEIEVGEALARRQAGLDAVALDAPGRAIGQLDLDQAGEQLGRRPSFPIGGLGEAFPVRSARSAGLAGRRRPHWRWS
jgi:hypothetical protein